MIFYWRVGSDEGKQRLKEYPELAKLGRNMKNAEDNYIVEIRDATTNGDVIGKVIVDTGNRSFSIFNGMSKGNWLILYDDEGRVLSYKISTNELHQRFFGHYAAVNPSREQILIENYPGEISINSLETGELKGKLVLDGDVVFARFSVNGRGLFILTNKQTVYAFDMNKVIKSKAQIAKLVK